MEEGKTVKFVRYRDIGKPIRAKKLICKTTVRQNITDKWNEEGLAWIGIPWRCNEACNQFEQEFFAL